MGAKKKKGGKPKKKGGMIRLTNKMEMMSSILRRQLTCFQFKLARLNRDLVSADFTM